MSREWISYIPPPEPFEELSVTGAKETWIELANLIIDDLNHLLGLPYHVFWSHVMFDRTLLITFGRLLKRFPRDILQDQRGYPGPALQLVLELG